MKVTRQSKVHRSSQCVLTTPDVFDQQEEDAIVVLLKPARRAAYRRAMARAISSSAVRNGFSCRREQPLGFPEPQAGLDALVAAYLGQGAAEARSSGSGLQAGGRRAHEYRPLLQPLSLQKKADMVLRARRTAAFGLGLSTHGGTASGIDQNRSEGPPASKTTPSAELRAVALNSAGKPPGTTGCGRRRAGRPGESGERESLQFVDRVAVLSRAGDPLHP